MDRKEGERERGRGRGENTIHVHEHLITKNGQSVKFIVTPLFPSPPPPLVLYCIIMLITSRHV